MSEPFYPRLFKSARMVFFIITVTVYGGMPRPASAFTDVGSGQIFFGGEGGTPALHLNSHVNFSINGIVAHVTVKQEFSNQTGEWQEAIYVFPLPETAAVNSMTMTIGERVIKAEIKEKQEARKIYQAAKAEGKKAALTEQSRPNLFQQAVANIAPAESIIVTLKFVQKIDYDAGNFSLRFPMTITPRFIPGSPLIASVEGLAEAVELSPNTKGWALATAAVPDAHLITPPMIQSVDDAIVNPISIDIELDPGLPLKEVGSLYHDISVSKAGDVYRIGFVEQVVPMDRDFVLAWRSVMGSEPRAAVFRETLGAEDYLLLMMLPPEEDEELAALPRDMLFVIDTSGSMQGSSIDQAKKSLTRALDNLRPGDRFNIIEFNSTSRKLFHTVQVADHYYVSQARTWVALLRAGGGTNMAPALAQAIDSPESEHYLKHIVFITDGAVGNEQGLFEMLHHRLGSARLFTVGIGSAPNSHFMRQAAKFGRGTFTHVGKLDEVESRMDNLYSKIDSPLATDIVINWPGEVEVYPARLPALYRGEPLLVVGRAPHLSGIVEVSGLTAHSPWHQRLSIDVKDSRPGVGTLWARSKIEALEDDRVAGRDAEEVKEELIAVALKHHLVSRYTSLVAVEEWVSRLPGDNLQTSAVPNLVARGQQLQTVMYPRTATNGPLLFLIGLLSLLLASSIKLYSLAMIRR